MSTPSDTLDGDVAVDEASSAQAYSESTVELEPLNGHDAYEPSMTEPQTHHPLESEGEQSSDIAEIKAILEAVLFMAHEPLSLDRLVGIVAASSMSDVRAALLVLQSDYDQQLRGLQVVEVAGGYRLVTRQDYAPWVKRLEKTKPAPKLSRSALESLAIIAYRQPLTRGEVEKIRGVETSGVIKTLLERKLVRIVGRQEVPGRPILYGTTKFFLEHFGLPDLSALPPLREFRELGESEQAMLPVEGEPIVVGECVSTDTVTSDSTQESDTDAQSSDVVACVVDEEPLVVGGHEGPDTTTVDTIFTGDSGTSPIDESASAVEEELLVLGESASTDTATADVMLNSDSDAPLSEEMACAVDELDPVMVPLDEMPTTAEFVDSPEESSPV
jgi:segregation and condensation protein B